MIPKEMIEAAAWAYANSSHRINSLSRMEEALTAAHSLQWRGMESAPRDGTEVLLYIPKIGPDRGGWMPHVFGGKDGSWWSHARICKPTAWQPLPPPPDMKE